MKITFEFVLVRATATGRVGSVVEETDRWAGRSNAEKPRGLGAVWWFNGLDWFRCYFACPGASLA